MRNSLKLWAVVLPVAVLAAPVWAHPGHAEHGFTDGLTHPLLGIDHLLAMVAVGIWALQLGRQAVWSVPLAFVVSMCGGAMMALAGLPLPYVESGVLTSVVVLGLMIATAARVPTPVAAIGVGLFAILHGHAHFAGVATATSTSAYLAAFAVTTAALHLVGLGLGAALSRGAARQWVRYAGGAVAAAGLALIATV